LHYRGSKESEAIAAIAADESIFAADGSGIEPMTSHQLPQMKGFLPQFPIQNPFIGGQFMKSPVKWPQYDLQII
jgi:hypothetical protein